MNVYQSLTVFFMKNVEEVVAGKDVSVPDSSRITRPNSPEFFKDFKNDREVFACSVTE